MKSKLLAFDAFAKTVEDARVRTTSGGLVTMTCLVAVVLLILNEWNEFNTVKLHPEIVVDRDRAKRLDVNLDISFPKLPCEVLTLDIMDVSGELQEDVAKFGFTKIRLAPRGHEIAEEALTMGNEDGKDTMMRIKGSDYCGPCYGAKDQSNNDNDQVQKVCCNSCEEVRQAYVKAGWAFFDGKDVEQCEQEGYVSKINERLHEGCRIKGTANINRVAGNLHIAPGASYTGQFRHIHDLSLFEKHEHFTFEHVINHLSFGPDPGSDLQNNNDDNNIKNLMFSTHPLDGFKSTVDERFKVYSYFVKVVSTRYEFLNHTFLETNQFSATKHNRPLQGGPDEDHKHTIHSRGGHPAVFFNLEISPIKVINREEYSNTWGSFFLSVCSAIGGVLTIGAVVDRTIYETDKVIRSKKDT
ncbi:Erv46 protein [Saccharomycopsis crataegensis]|uniref:Endoplasmic reticulum-Golgi intermediate compartment protein n=1 Tax=Saccharomycopsis crataegensis TaxID=43959 RepID=A0AAV5QLM5_9ASCO|nr:Erv46 protein [Saccharomycopsis crataegensis]